ncbi:MAG: transcriptional regulator, TetR family [Actinomycetia bacterium]|jgi:AcrR family transcriptional regulator|nr:transcriptional regulator, TetR family [Actinomycetes bacterium]
MTTALPHDPTRTALARSQAARRRRVIDATLQLAGEGGFDAVQMRDVAAAADVALGTVYRYFSSKERLLLEAMAEQQADLRAHLQGHPPPGATASERVSNVLRRANRALKRHPDVTAAMVRAFGSARPEDADVVRRVGEIMGDVITRAIRPDGETTDRDVQVARVLTLVWNSSLVGWVGGVDPAERVDEDLEIAARFLLDDPATAEPASS